MIWLIWLYYLWNHVVIPYWRGDLVSPWLLFLIPFHPLAPWIRFVTKPEKSQPDYIKHICFDLYQIGALFIVLCHPMWWWSYWLLCVSVCIPFFNGYPIRGCVRMILKGVISMAVPFIHLKHDQQTLFAQSNLPLFDRHLLPLIESYIPVQDRSWDMLYISKHVSNIRTERDFGSFLIGFVLMISQDQHIVLWLQLLKKHVFSAVIKAHLDYLIRMWSTFHWSEIWSSTRCFSNLIGTSSYCFTEIHLDAAFRRDVFDLSCSILSEFRKHELECRRIWCQTP